MEIHYIAYIQYDAFLTEHETPVGQHTYETPRKAHPTSQHHYVPPQSMNDKNNAALPRTYARRFMDRITKTSFM
jgi:hypothetical protein